MPRKLLKFLIIFDNPSLLFFPGQFLSGRVLLELQDDTAALGLHFHVSHSHSSYMIHSICKSHTQIIFEVHFRNFLLKLK